MDIERCRVVPFKPSSVLLNLCIRLVQKVFLNSSYHDATILIPVDRIDIKVEHLPVNWVHLGVQLLRILNGKFKIEC